MNSARGPKTFVALATALCLGGPALAAPTAPQATYDPAEGVNRKIFGFNQAVDRHVLTPVARAYAKAPVRARLAVRNFVTNLSEPETFANDVLQLHPRRAGVTFARFGLNTTVGVAGLFDVAERFKLEHHDGDFGQTLGRWGTPPGPAVQLPIFGPSSVRDALGGVAGKFLDPFSYPTGTVVTATRASLGVTEVVSVRAAMLPLTDRLHRDSPDYYVALRDFAAKRRQALVDEARTGAVATDPDDAAAPPAIADAAVAGRSPQQATDGRRVHAVAGRQSVTQSPPAVRLLANTSPP